MTMNNNQTTLTKEQVVENYHKKVQQARINNQLMNEARIMKERQNENPELFNFIEALARKGGLPILKRLHIMLTKYIQLVEFNGGKK